MDLKKVARLVEEGKNITAIAKACDITRKTLYDRAKKDPKLAAILKGVNTAHKNAKPLDYNLVKSLSRFQCAEFEIAEEAGLSKDAFYRRKVWDEELVAALEAGRARGNVSMRRQMYVSAIDRFMTICKDCGRIMDDKFHGSCLYCDDEDPDGKHTNVIHKFVPGSVTAQIWWSKNHLGMADKIDTNVSVSDTSLLDAIKSQATDVFADEVDQMGTAKQKAT